MDTYLPGLSNRNVVWRERLIPKPLVIGWTPVYRVKPATSHDRGSRVRNPSFSFTITLTAFATKWTGWWRKTRWAPVSLLLAWPRKRKRTGNVIKNYTKRNRTFVWWRHLTECWGKLPYLVFFSFVKNRSCVTQLCITKIAAKCILVVNDAIVQMSYGEEENKTLGCVVIWSYSNFEHVSREVARDWSLLLEWGLWINIYAQISRSEQKRFTKFFSFVPPFSINSFLFFSMASIRIEKLIFAVQIYVLGSHSSRARRIVGV